MPRSRSSPWSAGLGQEARRAATSSTAPAPSDDIRVYQPSTLPGAPLPHAWIDDEDGRRRPVKDLVAPGGSC